VKRTFKDYLRKAATKYGTRDEIARRAIKSAKEHGITHNKKGNRITIASAKGQLNTLLYDSKWGYSDYRVQVRGKRVRIKSLLRVVSVCKTAPKTLTNPISAAATTPSLWSRIKGWWTK
jgi:hypothetical protein